MKTTLILCIFTLAIWATCPANAVSLKKLNGALADSIIVDPICQMKVKSNSKIASTYKEKKYRFCNVNCKTKFDKNPENYIKK